MWSQGERNMRVSPQNILISHVYSSDNKGDAALTSVLISDLRQKFPNAKLHILTLEPSKKMTLFEGVPQQPSFMYYALNKVRNPFIKLAYIAYMLPITILWALWFRATGWRMYLPKDLRAVAEAYASADLVVAVGGGYIRSRKEWVFWLNVPLLLHPLLFGAILQKPTYLYPQSIGPFFRKFETALVTFVLKRMALIILREDVSVALLAKMGVTRNVVRSVDSGFLLQSSHKINVREQYSIDANALLVGVTVRSWLKGSSQTEYEQAVAAALDNLVAHSRAHILFIPQVTAVKGDDDRVVARRVHKCMHNAHAATTITKKLDHHTIKSIYDDLDVLLGTRFHSVIFSLTSHVPVLAIEYEHKTSGIMHDLALDAWVIKIEDVTKLNLTHALQNLVKERGSYRTYLIKRLPSYIQQARQTIDMVAQNYAPQAQLDLGNNDVVEV
jgi:colanic acid/amylovoran biosynthesis protein